MFPVVVSPVKHRRRRFGGCVWGCLTTLVILLLLVGAGWLLILRPYLHSLAEAQIDQALSSAVNQMPAQVTLLPSGPLSVQENTINNLIVLNLAPTNPVQKPQTQISPSGIRVAFQLYGFPCAIAGVPTVVNGQLVASQVTVDGIIGLVMSPDEMTALLNKHLADAQSRLKHTVTNVTLHQHEMDIILG